MVVAVAAPGNRGLRAGRLAVMASLAVVVGACGGRPGTSTVMPRPSTVPLAATSTLAPTTTSAATATGSESLTGEEGAWIQALTRLEEELFDVLADAPSDLTTATMRSYADRLHGCRRGLARIGSPSERLQPAYRLARKACAQFDKGARCFADAASIGAPLAGSAEERRFDQAITCGFQAPSNGGALLIEAEAEAEAVGSDNLLP
jgi:hypothetical protein